MSRAIAAIVGAVVIVAGAVLAVLIFWGALPAQGHSIDEYEAHKRVLVERMESQGVDSTTVAAYVDWIARHTDHEHPAPPLRRSSSISAQSVGDSWEGLVRAHFPESELATALRVIECESHGNPNARNPSSGASGLFQVMPFWADHFGVSRESLFAAEVNVAIARKVWDEQGWGAWVCY